MRRPSGFVPAVGLRAVRPASSARRHASSVRTGDHHGSPRTAECERRKYTHSFRFSCALRTRKEVSRSPLQRGKNRPYARGQTHATLWPSLPVLGTNRLIQQKSMAEKGVLPQEKPLNAETSAVVGRRATKVSRRSEPGRGWPEASPQSSQGMRETGAWGEDHPGGGSHNILSLGPAAQEPQV